MRYLIAILIVFNSILLPQEKSNSYIFGNIIDAETLEPLENANIFIANSSIGTASDRNGHFELRDLPNGRFEIIASRIGYEVLNVKIYIYRNQRRNLRFEMYKEPVQLPEITVSAKASRKRKQQLKKFRRNFLGNSQNGKESYIRNEEVLRFDDDRYGLLTAHAIEPLEIVNNSLGYYIKYVLDEFEMTKDYVKYKGYPYFKEKTAKTFYDSVEWKKNRELTYLGSLRHFLTTICINYDETAGDITDRVTTLHLDDVTAQGVKVSYGDIIYVDEEGFDVLSLYYPLGEQKAGVRDLLNTNKVLSLAENDNELLMHFDNYLEIKYEKEYFPFEDYYLKNKKISWITMTTDTTILDKQGRYFDKYAIKTKGIWSLERVADMLPFDYKVNKE